MITSYENHYFLVTKLYAKNINKQDEARMIEIIALNIEETRTKRAVITKTPSSVFGFSLFINNIIY